STMFEQFGFVYLGPVDGHNFQELEEALRAAKCYDAPVFIHVKTVKGKGYPPAERNPSQFHGVSKFDVMTGNPEVSGSGCYSDEFGKALTELAKQDSRICAITAAMTYGTGLQYFQEKFPERFYDVGIAEQHAVTFAAGLASAGMKPVFAVYSTFLQRAYDQLLHDVSIGQLKVVLGIDRAGIVGEDGETHQGMFDVPMLTSIPGTAIYSPACYEELKICLKKAIYKESGLTAVRYPRGNDADMNFPKENSDADYILTECQSDLLLISYGRVYQAVWDAHNICAKSGYPTSILKLTKIFPVPEELVEIALQYKTVLFFEESSGYGGISTIFGSLLAQYGFQGQFVRVSADCFLKQASIPVLLDKSNLSTQAVCRYIYTYGCQD
ncbi:MAG: 1-deoxy-D-xylulose-5-phosphate synthase, partial [Oscillospiraceae bacterium]|nr:1-deoxy-D-xylulose-5-phosphate synthase [Oscillospiraceae bacterium]